MRLKGASADGYLISYYLWALALCCLTLYDLYAFPGFMDGLLRRQHPIIALHIVSPSFFSPLALSWVVLLLLLRGAYTEGTPRRHKAFMILLSVITAPKLVGALAITTGIA